jgi:hypothetical protein
MTMIKVRKILGDDIFGLWHIKQIIINKDGERFSFTPESESFPTKGKRSNMHIIELATSFSGNLAF